MSVSGQIISVQWATRQGQLSEEESNDAIRSLIYEDIKRQAKSLTTNGGDIFDFVKTDIRRVFPLPDRELRRMVAKAEAEARADYYALSSSAAKLKINEPKSINHKLTEFEEIIRSWGDKPVLFGIHELDECFGGLYPGEIMTVNGAPGGMKTSLALNAMSYFINNEMGKVLYVSVDMSPEEIYFRLVLRECMDFYSERELRRMVAHDSIEYQKAKESMIERYGEYLICEGHNPRDRLGIDKLKFLIGIHMPDLVIIDYLTMLDRGDVDDLKFVNMAMPQIHATSKELSIPFIVLSQMSRASRIAQAGGAMGGHAKGGAIVEELAVVEIELRREESEDGDKPEIYATVTKTRRGIAGKTFRLEYKGNSMRFTGKADEAERVSARKSVFKIKGGY